MRITNISNGIKGSRLLYENAYRYAYMIQEEAKRRIKILTFWSMHGLQATKDAFNVSKATLYRWKAKIEESGGKIDALNNQSRAPKKRNKRRVDYRIEEYIIMMRTKHPNIGEKKLAPLLKVQCISWGISPPSRTTVGRIIKDLKETHKLPQRVRLSLNGKTGKLHTRTPQKRKKLRRKGHKADNPGALVELDTVVFYINGVRRYIITAIDLCTRTAYAKAYKSPSSASATDFFKELETVLPFSISHIQTDNGSEFEKHFRQHVERLGIVHFNTYPRCPKMNAHIERFNGTIQREFAMMHLGLLSVDVDAFQEKLREWLLWYNTERPHEGIGLVSPLWYFSNQLVGGVS